MGHEPTGLYFQWLSQLRLSLWPGRRRGHRLRSEECRHQKPESLRSHACKAQQPIRWSNKFFRLQQMMRLPPTWILQQNAIAADPKVKDDPVLSARVATPGELDRVMAKATWIFQTRGGEIFWRSTSRNEPKSTSTWAPSGVSRLVSIQVPQFARDWLDTSASAVLTFEKTYPALLPIFHIPGRMKINTLSCAIILSLGSIDIIFGPIASELIFVVVCALIVVLSLTNRAFRPAVALCGATVITVGGYSFIMAASETISDRYRMPSSFLLSVLTVCLIGILLDFARRYAFRKPDAISRHASARTAAAARALTYRRIPEPFIHCRSPQWAPPFHLTFYAPCLPGPIFQSRPEPIDPAIVGVCHYDNIKARRAKGRTLRVPESANHHTYC